ncbi:fimbrial protein [Paraburkholderia sp. ZP32-5]|uniref:fimbrial protein n=1 Tax=Paraburkholderia sp. ZP32-5 TaxID=2883245 RepID=UPI001F3E2D67|nr:fimbrial protein [Paraburkholderia sp. ZP32-5]
MPELAHERAMRAGKTTMFDNGNVKYVMTMLRTLVGGGRSRWHQLVIAMLLVCGFASHAAHATTTCTPIKVTGGDAGSTTVTLPPVTAAPTEPNGTVLGKWQTFNTGNLTFNCFVDSSSTANMVFQPSSLVTPSGIKVAEPTNGTSVTVWNTNLAGVGIAVAVNASGGSCSTSYQDLAAKNISGWTGTLCVGSGGGFNYRYTGLVEVALVKIGDITAGTVNNLGTIFKATVATNVSGVVKVGTSTAISNTSGSTFMWNYLMGSAPAVSVQACSTPDVSVDLGSHPLSEFTGIGSPLNPNPTKFNVAFNNCPSGFNKIQYQFIPVNAVLDPTNGVIALSSDSSATGIGIQLKDGNQAVLKYNTQYTLSSYNTATGGSYTIPLTANYYQTAASVTPGSANAVLQLTLSYQ